MSEKIICGIDIGSSKIATVVALESKEHDEIRIIGFNATQSKGVKKGLIVDIDQVTTAVEESVEKAERMAGHKITTAYVSVGGPHISSLNSHGVVAVSNPQGEIAREDVVRVIEAARAISLSTTRQIIEVSPREYSVDGQAGIRNPVGMTGVRLEIDTHIITASTTNLKNIERCISDLGIEPVGEIFSGLSAAEAVLTDTEKDLGVAVIDIGGGKVDMCMYVEGALSHSVSLPVGAKHITNDIAVGLRVSLQSAEKIKLHLSNRYKMQGDLKTRHSENLNTAEIGIPEQIEPISVKTVLDGIIGPRLEEIYKYAAEAIEKSGFAKQIPSGLVITGGGAHTVGMIEMGKKIVGLPIRVGVPDKATGLVDEILDPQYAATIGLVLYAREEVPESHQPVTKNFNKMFRGVNMGNPVDSIKSFLKQFIP